MVNDASGIAIQHHNGRSALMENGALIPESMMYGIATKPKINFPVSGFTAVGVIFHPHGIHALFGLNAYALTGQEIHLNDFADWNITDAMLNTTDVYKQVDILAAFLTRLLGNKHGSDHLIRDCLHKIQVNKGLLTVKDLLRHYKISERQLQRKFSEVIGVSPRHYLKITRFQEVLNVLKHANNTKLSDVAYSLNYADQAHFIRHVRQLSGLSPKELNKRLEAIPMNQTESIPYLAGTTKNSLN